MSNERWFPIKYELLDGTKLGKLVASGGNWQIYRVDQKNEILTAETSLAERWVSEGLIHQSALVSFSFGEVNYVAIESGEEQQLTPVSEFNSPETKTDAEAFAVSLRDTRRVAPNTPLHDAIYVERFSRLLPTWTVSEKVADQEILGRWLTGGVSVSASSFRRLSNLLGWLDEEDVKEVIQSAGFTVPNERTGTPTRTQGDAGQEVGTRSKAKSKRKQHSDEAASGLSECDDAVFRLPGRPYLETFFNDHVVDIIMHEEQYEALGIGFPAAVVLHGPPGCGKTFAVERLVEFLDWPVFDIDSNSVGSPYIHETSRKVSEVFEKATKTAPSVVVIDEMESFLSDRQLHQSTGLHHVEEVGEFLRRIPEAMSKNVLVIGMTNRLEMIDPAVLRRGRFDHVIEVGMPSKEEVSQLLSSLLAKMPIESELSIGHAISSLTGRPLSDAAFAMREAARLAALSRKKALDQQSLDDALASLPPVEEEGKSKPIGFIWN